MAKAFKDSTRMRGSRDVIPEMPALGLIFAGMIAPGDDNESYCFAGA